MSAKPLRLITLPISHYCEKVRWALDRQGIAYREEAHAPIFHGLYTLPLTLTISHNSPEDGTVEVAC